MDERGEQSPVVLFVRGRERAEEFFGKARRSVFFAAEEPQLVVGERGALTQESRDEGVAGLQDASLSQQAGENEQGSRPHIGRPGENRSLHLLPNLGVVLGTSEELSDLVIIDMREVGPDRGGAIGRDCGNGQSVGGAVWEGGGRTR